MYAALFLNNDPGVFRGPARRERKVWQIRAKPQALHRRWRRRQGSRRGGRRIEC
jgi:hypothetical protein